MTIPIILVGQSSSQTSRRLGCGTFIFWAHFAHPSAALWALTLSLVVISSYVVHHFKVYKIPRILTPHLLESSIHITLFLALRKSMHACFLHAPHSSDTQCPQGSSWSSKTLFCHWQSESVLPWLQNEITCSNIHWFLPEMQVPKMFVLGHCTAQHSHAILGMLHSCSNSTIWHFHLDIHQPTNPILNLTRSNTNNAINLKPTTQSMNELNWMTATHSRLQAACAWHRGDLQAGFCSKIFENPTLCVEVWGKTAW